MKKIIARLLILIGITIVIGTRYLNNNIEENNNKIVKKYEAIIENTSSKDVEVSNSVDIPENILGILEIPKIDLKVMIQEGTDDKTLDYAVGHFKESKMPGEYGNFAIAGHRNYTHNKFFSNLDKVQEGDILIVNTIDGKYSYRVTSTEVVTPDKVEVIDSSEDKKEITLVTCTPKYVGSHRLIVKGDMS